MNGAGDQLLAGSSFSGDEDGFGVAGDAVDHAHELVHHGTGDEELGALDDPASDGKGGNAGACGTVRGNAGLGRYLDDNRGHGGGN